MSQNFLSRLFSQLMNEVVIKGLAESRTFQRFAVKTQSSIEELKKTGTGVMEEGIEHIAKMSTETGAAGNTASKSQPPQPPLRGVPGFFSAFGKEIRKDLGM
mmetsp:Transcript_22935/g.32821  ORF Transcript_22935/g.32821 Transcript_22935/m.32821 type:complete len:102 (-) Transcript_22935:146-451(-)|eukprot:CAMPEP_0202443580 /NCGR_PEP_ID=MMETSP1360-20130828/2800_1 /ASSEMBLY_ACC=CAM_ASM_000848 /TAXON_ID=515479 /ORGANISM="Licmophora paradoxa, Strain CCMP2313" /LENGTH=101 /DNA_ID=CAMNT_0049059303 /DNA_START=61 /DNA_END=366 /DNA_ORIENTATION=+